MRLFGKCCSRCTEPCVLEELLTACNRCMWVVGKVASVFCGPESQYTFHPRMHFLYCAVKLEIRAGLRYTPVTGHMAVIMLLSTMLSLLSTTGDHLIARSWQPTKACHGEEGQHCSDQQRKAFQKLHTLHALYAPLCPVGGHIRGQVHPEVDQQVDEFAD
eukprot:1157536-Pelagomonas_calceolata.AAC.5